MAEASGAVCGSSRKPYPTPPLTTCYPYLYPSPQPPKLNAQLAPQSKP